MQILAHRGFWKQVNEKNSMLALTRAIENQFGIETDLRDHNGQIVISHDLPRDGEILFKDFLKIYRDMKSEQTLALNIKADGLQDALSELLNEFKIKNYFVFDMSIPDTLRFMRKNTIFFERQSEFEKNRIFKNESAGVWLDAFRSEWYLKQLPEMTKENSVCVVSSELHGRDSTNLWNSIKKLPEENKENVLLCTDFPDRAMEFFL